MRRFAVSAIASVGLFIVGAAVALLGASTASASVMLIFGKDGSGNLTVTQSGTLDFSLFGFVNNLPGTGSTDPGVLNHNPFGPQVLFGVPPVATTVSYRALQFDGAAPQFESHFPAALQTSISPGSDTGGILNGGGGPTAFGIDGVRFDNTTTGVQTLSSFATYSIMFDDVPFGTNFFGTYTLANSGNQTVTLGVSAVPLPSGVVLLLSGLAGLGFVARRRRTA